MFECECRQENGFYRFFVNGTLLRTPTGNPVETRSKPLAERIRQDVSIYGPDVHSEPHYSILPCHFTYLDNFKAFGHDRVLEILVDSFPPDADWSYSIQARTDDKRTMDLAKKWFGAPSSRGSMINTWLSRCSVVQMTAACCVANAWHSMNVAYAMAAARQRGRESVDELADLLQTIIFWPRSAWEGEGCDIVVDSTGAFDSEIEYIPTIMKMRDRRKMMMVDYVLFDLYYGVPEIEV